MTTGICFFLKRKLFVREDVIECIAPDPKRDKLIFGRIAAL